uniref:Putative monocarboxylate transporter n=1 Tax=Ixodes ricinus TaxID=34613 RepID=A0A0K8RBY5_IXORI
MALTEVSPLKGTVENPQAQVTSWHVILIVACITFLALGALESMGYLYIEYVNEFDADRRAAEWPNSVMTALGGSVALLLPLLHKRFSIIFVMVAGSILAVSGLIASGFTRDIGMLVFTMGVLHGLGAGTVNASASVLTAMHFEKLRGFALGCVAIGNTLSGLVFPRLLKLLTETYGFRYSFVIWGALEMNLVPISCLLKVPPAYRSQSGKTLSPSPTSSTPLAGGEGPHNEIAQESYGRAEEPGYKHFLSNIIILAQNPVFYVLIATACLSSMVQLTLFTSMIDFAVDQGSSISDASWLTPCYLFSCSLAHIGLPLLADKGYQPRGVVLTECLFTSGGALLLLPHATSFWIILLLIVLQAAGYAGGETLQEVLTIDSFGMNRLFVMKGILGTAKIPFLLCAPALIGIFRDVQGSYENLYHLGGGLLMFPALLWLMVSCKRKHKHNFVLH